MQFEIQAKIVINVESSNLMEVLRAFLRCLGSLFEQVLSHVVLHYASLYATNSRMQQLLNLSATETWHWKNKLGYHPIAVKTLFGKILLPNHIVEILRQDGNRQKMTLGRKLIEISPYFQIPDEIKELVGTLGALMSYRNVLKSMLSYSLLGISLSSIWRCLQWSTQGLVLPIESPCTRRVLKQIPLVCVR